MNKDIEMVTVTILDRPYQVACPHEERAGLEASARYLDHQMRAIRSKGKVVGVERIAVMAALNITHDMLQKSDQVNHGGQETLDHLNRLNSKLDKAINFYRQLEM